MSLTQVSAIAAPMTITAATFETNDAGFKRLHARSQPRSLATATDPPAPYGCHTYPAALAVVFSALKQNRENRPGRD